MLESSDLGLFKCSNPTLNLTTTNVGGGIGGVQITGSTIGEVFPAMTPGSAPVVIYNKVFAVNGNTTDPAIGCLFWIDNVMMSAGGSSLPITIQSANASDGGTKKVRIIGFDNGGAPQTVELALSPQQFVSTSVNFGSVSRIELRNVASPFALVTAAADINIYHGGDLSGVLLGRIPVGFTGATSEVSMGLEAALNGTSIIANAQTAPAGVTFTHGSGFSAGLPAWGGGTIPPGESQGIWWKLSLAALVGMSPDMQTVFHFRANAA